VVQKAEESLKQYRKWLQAMCNLSRELLATHEAVTQAKADHRVRLEDLAAFLHEAESFITTEKSKSGRRRRKDADGCVLIMERASSSEVVLGNMHVFSFLTMHEVLASLCTVNAFV
jgi:hypothetical protein